MIYNFVKQNLLIEHIGKDLKSKNDGIFFINNNINNTIQVYYFRVPFLWGGINSSVLMKLYLIQNYLRENGLKESLDEVKNMLLEKSTFLDKRAMFKIESDLEFPFKETILPIAKRRIMKILAE